MSLLPQWLRGSSLLHAHLHHLQYPLAPASPNCREQGRGNILNGPGCFLCHPGAAGIASSSATHMTPSTSRWAGGCSSAGCPGRGNGFGEQVSATRTFVEALFLKVKVSCWRTKEEMTYRRQHGIEVAGVWDTEGSIWKIYLQELPENYNLSAFGGILKFLHDWKLLSQLQWCDPICFASYFSCDLHW